MSECGCTVESLTAFIRENAADCLKDKKKRSDEYVRCAIQYAIQQVVSDKSDDFQQAIQIKLKNGECIQSACDKCSGIVDIVGNVNGDCDDPVKADKEEREKNAYYARVYDSLACEKENDSDGYSIETFEILGDGGCQFKVEPKVPETGDWYVHVLCVVIPDTTDGNIPEPLCRFVYLVAAAALFWIYTYEADPAMKAKAEMFLNAYKLMVEMSRDINRDVFVESIKFGTRVGTDEQ